MFVGEVTTYIEGIDEAEREFKRLLERIKIVEEIYGRRVEMKFLAVENVSREALGKLNQLAEKYGVRIIYGKEIYSY